MTPQLQQAIRLLQLSSGELELEIQEALDTNFMLESSETEEESDDPLAKESDHLLDNQLQLPQTKTNWKSIKKKIQAITFLRKISQKISLSTRLGMIIIRKAAVGTPDLFQAKMKTI